MKNVLILLGKYLPNPDNNGVCVQEIVKELKKRKVNVFIISTNSGDQLHYENFDTSKVYRIPENRYLILRKKLELTKGIRKVWYASMVNILRLKLNLAWLLYYYAPLKRINNYYNKANEIINSNNIDTVICVSRPIETLYSGIKLKKKYPYINFVPYFLDSLEDTQPQNMIKRKIFTRNVKKFYQKILKYCDVLLTMENTRERFKPDYFDEFRDKIIYSELPLFHEPVIKNNIENYFDSRKINIVYTGSLAKNIREPDRILELFSKIINDIPNCVLHFYSRGCEDSLKYYKEILGDNLVIHGYVSLEESYTAMLNADFLLNISNIIKSQVPGKIFEYFATGKPIINFMFNKDDPAFDYYNRYNLICNINNWQEDIDYKEVVLFINECFRKRLKYEELIDIYKNNIPSYTLDLLESSL